MTCYRTEECKRCTSFVIRFLRLFIKIKSTETFHLTWFFMSADLSVSRHYVITLRRGRPREQLLLQNYKV